MTNRRLSRNPFWRALAVIAPAAVLAAMIAVGPSFAGSFLTHREAVKTFVKKKQAEQKFLTAKAAKELFVQQGEVAAAPASRIVQSTVDTGPIYSKTAYDIPGARAVFKTEAPSSNVVISFSGQAPCVAATGGVGCPIQVLVDGYATGKVNFLASTAGSPQPKETVHTVVQSALVTPGKHVISVRYAGTTDPSVGFKVFDFNLITQAYPDGQVAPGMGTEE